MGKGKNSTNFSRKLYIPGPVTCMGCGRIIGEFEIGYVNAVGILCEKCAWGLKNES